MNSSAKALLLVAPGSVSASPNTARASKPPSPNMPRVRPKVKAKPRKRRRSLGFFSAHSLLPMCGSRPKGRWDSTMAATDHQELYSTDFGFSQPTRFSSWLRRFSTMPAKPPSTP